MTCLFESSALVSHENRPINIHWSCDQLYGPWSAIWALISYMGFDQLYGSWSISTATVLQQPLNTGRIKCILRCCEAACKIALRATPASHKSRSFQGICVRSARHQFTDGLVQNYMRPSKKSRTWIDMTQISGILLGLIFGIAVLLIACFGCARIFIFILDSFLLRRWR